MPRSKPAAIKIRVRIVRGEEDAFGPGKAQLLESLLETGSLNRSASALKMSYVKALALVRTMNAHFCAPLVALSRGGSGGGGAVVTETGRAVLAEYQEIRAACDQAATSHSQRISRWLKD